MELFYFPPLSPPGTVGFIILSLLENVGTVEWKEKSTDVLFNYIVFFIRVFVAILM